MHDEEKLKELINELIEVIQSSIQDSSDVHRVLQKIEENGFTLNLSMLIGIFVRDKDGVDMFFSSIGGETSGQNENRQRRVIPRERKQASGEIRPVPPHGTWTETDIQFLESLGIHFE